MIMPEDLRSLIEQTQEAVIVAEANRREKLEGLERAIFSVRCEAKMLTEVYEELLSRQP